MSSPATLVSSISRVNHPHAMLGWSHSTWFSPQMNRGRLRLLVVGWNRISSWVHWEVPRRRYTWLWGDTMRWKNSTWQPWTSQFFCCFHHFHGKSPQHNRTRIQLHQTSNHWSQFRTLHRHIISLSSNTGSFREQNNAHHVTIHQCYQNPLV